MLPECKDNIDSRMLKLVMKYDLEANSDDEKQAQIFLEKSIEDLAEAGIVLYYLLHAYATQILVLSGS